MASGEYTAAATASWYPQIGTSLVSSTWTRVYALRRVAGSVLRRAWSSAASTTGFR